MADINQLQTLISLLDRPEGRKIWTEFRFQHEWIDISAADLTGRAIRDFDLRRVNFSTAIFSGADLTGADLSGADITNADLRGASMRYADLTGAAVRNADVARADLTGAVLDTDAATEFRNFDQVVFRQSRYRAMGARHKVYSRQYFSDDQIRGSGCLGTNAIQEMDLGRHDHCCLVLGISTDADREEVTRAFRRKAKLYHPDMVRHLSPELQKLAAGEFRRLHAAYENLTHHGIRVLQETVWPPDVPLRPSPYDYSVEEYRKMLRINPQNTDVLYNLSWKYFENENFEKSREILNELLAIDPNDEDADYNLMVVNVFIALDLPATGLPDRNGAP